jgi:hypothetical protein
MTKLAKRFFSAKERRHDAKTGAAMAGGRYPIHNRRDLVHAEELMHHSSDQAAVAAHIRTRAKALGIKKRLNRIMKDWSHYDQERRGGGEKTGRLAGGLIGAGAGVKAAKFAAKALRGHGFGPRAGAAVVAGYGTYQGAKGAGGYIGRKVDEAAARRQDWRRDGLLGPDDHRGVGEKTGLLTGSVTGIVGGLKTSQLASRALRGAGSRTRAGAAVAAGVGTYLGARAAGGYIGRKVDEAAARRQDWRRDGLLGPGGYIGRKVDEALGKGLSGPDDHRGVGEKAGLLAGSVTGIVGGLKTSQLASRALRAGSRTRAGAAVAAGVGTYLGARAAGGYIGRKVDEALGKGLSGLTGLLDPNSTSTPLGTYQGMRQGRGKRFAGPSRATAGPDITKAHASARAKAKVARTMHEWGQGDLHSGSKHGPHVSSQKQAVAIALNQAGLSRNG